MRNSVRLQRLNKLLEVLQLQKEADALQIPARLNGIHAWFDMGSWFSESYAVPGGSVGKDGIWKPEHPCHTSACALGSCALYPWFEERGLHVTEAENVSYTQRGKRHSNFSAGAKFFGITMRESFYLFDPSHYRGAFCRYDNAGITPAEVAARVRKVINKYKRI